MSAVRYGFGPAGLWLAATLVTAASSPAAPPDPLLAARYFREADSLCAADSGRLWGRPLGGPLLFVDRPTRAAVGSRVDSGGVLTPNGDVYLGTLPASVVPANTAIDWGGVRWTMLCWPLPADSTSRRILLAHEMWHRVQESLGFPASNPDNPQLDQAGPRLWLRLEWRALARALESEGAERRAAVGDALLFRAYRRSLAPGSADTERSLEMNEGLAEYTGIALGAGDAAAARARAVEKLRSAEGEKSYVRSFAYASGPAYGLLLDAADPAWRTGLTPEQDLGLRLGAATGITLPDSGLREAARPRAASYGGEPLAVEEWNREIEMEKRQAELRVRYVDGPILLLPLRDARIGFDPNEIQPLGSFGAIYHDFTAADDWGVLTAPGGALLAKDWSNVWVPSPADSARAGRIRGDGWTLELKDGWRLEPGIRRGDLVLQRAR
ncbi:MAG TPA: hypothetical protein VID50_10755 [Candidatus Eisenbacteria bacterium]|jgi:hypothetical protein